MLSFVLGYAITQYYIVIEIITLTFTRHAA